MAQKLFRALSSSSEHPEQSYLEKDMGSESYRWRRALCFPPNITNDYEQQNY
jgi:hypothetical protein